MATRSRTDEANGELGELRTLAATRETDGWTMGSSVIAQQILNLRSRSGERDRLGVRAC
jgi:hypothetical protein